MAFCIRPQVRLPSLWRLSGSNKHKLLHLRLRLRATHFSLLYISASLFHPSIFTSLLRSRAEIIYNVGCGKLKQKAKTLTSDRRLPSACCFSSNAEATNVDVVKISAQGEGETTTICGLLCEGRLFPRQQEITR